MHQNGMAHANDEFRFEITAEELKEIVEGGAQKVAEYGGVENICRMLHTSPTEGLSDNDIKIRQKVFGSNEILKKKHKSFYRLIWEAMQDLTLIILMIAAVVSIGLSFYESDTSRTQLKDVDDDSSYNWIEGVAILITVIVVVLLTSCNDWARERQFRGLQRRIEEENFFTTIRNGTPQNILTNNIVVGDICHIKYGDKPPADGLIIQSYDVKIDESSMTGESEYVKKDVFNPVILSGTRVMEGYGKMVVVATGLNSQIGVISLLLGVVHYPKVEKAKDKAKKKQVKLQRKSLRKSIAFRRAARRDTVVITTTTSESLKDQSVLKVKLTRLALQIGYIGLVVAALTVIILITRFCVKTYIVDSVKWHNSHAAYFTHYIITGITVLVVAIPEGLPLAVTLALVYSVKKMMKDNNLVRHLDACETMGNATVICSDKTGTLTTNRMTVVSLYIGEKLYPEIPENLELQEHLIDILAEAISVNTSYSSNVRYSTAGVIQIGNRTECALLGFVEKLSLNYNDIRKMYPEDNFRKVYTFNSERKAMGTVIAVSDQRYRVHTKGASEVILEKYYSKIL